MGLIDEDFLTKVGLVVVMLGGEGGRQQAGSRSRSRCPKVRREASNRGL